MRVVQQYGWWYCDNCKKYQQPVKPQVQVQPTAVTMPSNIWTQNQYQIRKKVLALTNQYWIQDPHGKVLGYSKQKMLKIKEDIRIYTDEKMNRELFRIQQQQLVDIWGTYAIIDSPSNMVLGFVRRKALKSAYVKSSWQLLDANKNLVGEVSEEAGAGVMRRYLPGGGLIPISMTLTLNNYPVATINQQFKIIGDIWDIACSAMPHQFDRRVLLSCALLMGMIERDQK